MYDIIGILKGINIYTSSMKNNNNFESEFLFFYFYHNYILYK